uniref:MIF4G domain-containing protein n=1 Tax=Rhabditophanes sp. KR3021 TaxID=114890 RepID=A0AC35UHV7_9BILA
MLNRCLTDNKAGPFTFFKNFIENTSHGQVMERDMSNRKQKARAGETMTNGTSGQGKQNFDEPHHQPIYRPTHNQGSHFPMDQYNPSQYHHPNAFSTPMVQPIIMVPTPAQMFPPQGLYQRPGGSVVYNTRNVPQPYNMVGAQHFHPRQIVYDNHAPQVVYPVAQAPSISKQPRAKKVLQIVNPNLKNETVYDSKIAFLDSSVKETPKTTPKVVPEEKAKPTSRDVLEEKPIPKVVMEETLKVAPSIPTQDSIVEKATEGIVLEETPKIAPATIFDEATKQTALEETSKSKDVLVETPEPVPSITLEEAIVEKATQETPKTTSKVAFKEAPKVVVPTTTIDEVTTEKATKKTLVDCENKMKSFLEGPKLIKKKYFYSSDFIHVFKKAIALFKIHANPVEDSLKSMLYYDKNSADLSIMKKKRSEQQFVPLWHKNSSSGDKNRNGGRNSNSQRGNIDKRRTKQAPIVRQSTERNHAVETLTKSENAWKPTLGKISDEKDAKLKVIRGLLNKITPSNFENISTEFMQMNLHKEAPEFLKEITNLFFLKAVEETRFCFLYSDLFKRQIDQERLFSSSKGKLSTILITKCQSTFEMKDRPFKAEMDKLEEEVKNETDEKIIKEKKGRISELNEKEKKITFGTIVFLSHLYRHALLITKIISYCFTHLLVMFNQDKNEKTFEQAILLVENVGKDWSSREPNTLDNPYSITCAMKQINTYMFPGETSVELPKLSKRLQFMVQNLIETSKNDWNSTNVNLQKGPKKISEVHAEIKSEELEKENQREKFYNKKVNDFSPSDNKKRSFTPNNPIERNLEKEIQREKFYSKKVNDFSSSDSKKRSFTVNNTIERNLEKKFNNSNSRNSVSNRRFGDLKGPAEESHLSKGKKCWATGCSTSESKSHGAIPRTRNDNRGPRQSDAPPKNITPHKDRRNAPTTAKKGNGNRIQEFTDEKEFLAHVGEQAAVEEVQYNENIVKDIIEQLHSGFSDETVVESAKKIEMLFNRKTTEKIIGEIFDVIFRSYTMPKQSRYRCYTGRLIGELLSKDKKKEIISSIETFTEKLNDPENDFIEDCPLAWQYFGQMLASALLYCVQCCPRSNVSLYDFDKTICVSGDNKMKTIISLFKAAFTGDGICLSVDDDKFKQFVTSTYDSYKKISTSDDFFVSEKVGDCMKQIVIERDGNQTLFEYFKGCF